MSEISSRDGHRLRRCVSRRQFLAGSLAASAGLLALNRAAFAAPATRHLLTPAWRSARQGLAPGMVGGPTGFAGAERYQYPEDSQEGRAVMAAKALKAAGQAPDKIVMMMAGGAEGHWNQPFPEGAPTAIELWRQETGIDIELVSTPPEQMYVKAIQDITTRAAQFDIWECWIHQVGDLAETGAAVNLDEFVAKHRPEWDDPKWGMIPPGNNVTQKYKGSVWSVSLDGDWQIWFYRQDLMEDPKERADFKARYGWELQWPETWEQWAQVAEFFHRPDQGLIGATDLRNQYWGYVNWQQRYASMGLPSMRYWDDAMKPLITGPEGVKATQDYIDSMKWHHKDGVTWGWSEQYANMAAGGAFMSSAFPSMSKFTGPGNKESKVAGKIRAGIQPGTVINGKLVRRPINWGGNNYVVSGIARYPEVAYLLLQWASGGRIYPWLVANPAGFYDPSHFTDLTDPLVVRAYGEWLMPVFGESIKRSIPPFKLAGATEYSNALDNNLLQAISGQKSAEQAMIDTAAEWEKITESQGRDRQIAAWKAEQSDWSTLVDEPTIK